MKMSKGKIRQYLPAKQDFIHMCMTLILPPAVFFYEVLYILPALNLSRFHIYIGYYLLHNIGGNAFCGILTGPRSFVDNNKPPKNQDDWSLCKTCDTLSPPRSWHCFICNTCVVKRDHHCNFFGQCIGYHNHRYFMMFVFHAFISTLYALSFNLVFMIYYFEWGQISWLGMSKFFFPLAGFVVNFNEESIHILNFFITLIVTCFTGFLFFYHLRVIIRGQITPESKKEFRDIYNFGWKKNLMEVFGDRWYLTWISPFISSQLPGDGMSWHVRDGANCSITNL